MTKKSFKPIGSTAFVPKEQVSKKRLIVLVLALCILSALMTGALVYVTASPGPGVTTIVEEGSMVETASYVIFKDGSTYYAKNGTTGAIEYSGANASQILQSCINAIKISEVIFGEGGTIHFAQGTYEIHSINIRGSVRITGEGITNTILKFPDGVKDVYMFKYQRSNKEYFFQMENLYIDGNKDNGANGTFLYADNSAGGELNDVHIEHVWIDNFAKHGIDSDFGWGWRLTDMVIEHSGWSGAYFRDNASGLVIKGSTINSNDENGLVFSGYRLKVTDSFINNNKRNGIWLKGAFDCTIVGNTIKANSRESQGTYYGIYLSDGAEKNKIIGNDIVGSQAGTVYHKYGVKINSGCFDNRIEHNLFKDSYESNAIGNQIHISSGDPDNIAKFNEGFVTENSGYDPSVANGDWISHGLFDQPSVILLTPWGNANVYVDARNATHFKVGTSATVALWWYAEYHVG